TEYGGDQVAKVTTSGTFTEYPLAEVNAQPEAIVSLGGALWFTESHANNIATSTTGGAVTVFPVPSASTTPDGIAVGPDGNLWFTEFFGNKVGRALPAAVTALVLPSQAVPKTLTVVQGTTVDWMFLAKATIGGAAGIIDFGASPVAYDVVPLAGAGTYAYSDISSGAKAKVKVPLVVMPISGSVSTTFTVTWAAGAAPPGYVFDVQIKRPGSSSFVNW